MFPVKFLIHVLMGLDILKLSSSKGGFCKKTKTGKFVCEGNCGSPDKTSVLEELDAKLAGKKGSCTGVIYDNKCFIVVYWKSYSDQVDYAGAVTECERRGGYVANLYSQIHMDAVMSYIREQGWFDGNQWFRTGLDFDPLANKFTLRDGADAPDGLKWHPGYPRTGTHLADFTNVILYVVSNPSSINQYLFNYFPTPKTNVLCEIE